MRSDIVLGDGYIPDLLKRLKRDKISHRGLSKEMGIDNAQFSRWANRHVLPDMNSVIRIERAIARIMNRREKQAARTLSER